MLNVGFPHSPECPTCRGVLRIWAPSGRQRRKQRVTGTGAIRALLTGGSSTSETRTPWPHRYRIFDTQILWSPIKYTCRPVTQVRSLPRQRLDFSSKHRPGVRFHAVRMVSSIENSNNNLTGVIGKWKKKEKRKKMFFKVRLLTCSLLKIVDIFVLQHSLTDQTQPGQLCEEEWANIAPSQCTNLLKKKKKEEKEGHAL